MFDHEVACAKRLESKFHAKVNVQDWLHEIFQALLVPSSLQAAGLTSVRVGMRNARCEIMIIVLPWRKNHFRKAFFMKNDFL